MGNDGKNGHKVSRGLSKGKSQNLLSAFENEGQSLEAAGWDEASPAQIARLICCVVSFGGLCSFGRSRSGDVLSITVFLDGDKRTRWIRPEEDPDTVIDKLCLPFEASQ